MGSHGFFFVLRSEDDVLTYYESAIRQLSRDKVEDSDVPLREVMQLVCEWVSCHTSIFIYVSNR